MKKTRRLGIHIALLVTLVIALVVTSARTGADSGTCGGVSFNLPFTDVAGNTFFCEIAEAYFSGLAFGTTGTTYSPSMNVPRDQMAAFITRTMDQSLRRGALRAALNQWWTTKPHYNIGLGSTSLAGATPQLVASDGSDLWVAEAGPDKVARVRASDGKLLETWAAADQSFGVLSAMGRVFVTGATSPGKLYMIIPTQVAGSATTIATGLGDLPYGVAYDGDRIWTANFGQAANPGSVSIIDPTTVPTWTVQNVTDGFDKPFGILYDGTNIWVTDRPSRLLKLDSAGVILQTVPMPSNPGFPVFDGTNIWVPNFNGTVVVVQASTGTVLATLNASGLSLPLTAAFDGERILVTDVGGDNVSLWKAADLTPIGTFPTHVMQTFGACSDGINFWITSPGSKLLRF